MDSPLASPAELLNPSKSFVLLDARTGPDAASAHARAHLPGARFVDLERDLASPADPSVGGRHPLPEPRVFAETLGRLGIRPSDSVVVYDLAAGANAASRAWWMLRAFGHRDVRVLEGTPETWEAAGLRMTSEPSRFEPAPAYPADAYALPTVDADAVDRARTDSSFVVVDARSPARFRGEVEPIDPIAGHVPGARNLFHASLVDAEGRFLPRDVLRERAREVLGDVPIERAIVHCGSGVTACHAMLALAHAGLGTPALYVGSWSEWCRQDRPQAKGDS